MAERKIIYWDHEDQEHLTHEDMDDAIESILDDEAPCPLPRTMKICGYARMAISGEPGTLEDVLEVLDMEYGDPDGERSDPTPKMKLAEEMFLEVVRSEYEPWMCEIVETREIDVAEWVLEHRPDWFKAGVKMEEEDTDG